MGTAASSRMSQPQTPIKTNEDISTIRSFSFQPDRPQTATSIKETVNGISETTKQNKQKVHSDVQTSLNLTTKNIEILNFKILLHKLDIVQAEMESKINLFQDNADIQDMLQLATEVVVHCIDTNDTEISLMESLKKLDISFHDLSSKERTLLGDYLAAIMFSKNSLKRYKSILKDSGLDYFDDHLLIGEIPMDSEKILILNFFRSLWWNFSDVSSEFCYSLAKDGVLNEVVKDLRKLIGISEKELKHSFCFESCLGVLHNVAKNDDLRPLFRKYKVVDILGNFLKYENLTKITMLVLITLALIIDENQTHLLISNESVFNLILNMIKRSLGNRDHRFDGFSTVELMVSLTKLSKNDEVKKILVKKNVIDLVLSIFSDGMPDEIEWAAKLVWELSFAPENKAKISENESLMNNIHKLSSNPNHQIAKACQGVILILSEEKSSTHYGQQGHIMISYCWSNQKTVIQICDALKSNGYAIWIDVENISGSSVEAMAEAVEKCDVFLMCMSEKYKESTYCRSEADYAFKMKKPIIPLLLQNKYTPDGWLGFLLGSKIFFEFTGKYDFNAKLADLLREIGERGKIKKKVNGNMMVSNLQQSLNSLPPARNQDFDVNDWIVQNNLSQFTCITNLSYQHLLFLKNISFRAPEFYYNFIFKFINGTVTVEQMNSLMQIHNAMDKIKN
ncbi:uncharacterized protein LOC106061311 isoform X1 [Biomphalaria glabrata]|uniref:Uncharacterized protein LOC106061311 isoform X1 n=2 Tax=Biomphalaria glabrata TaxID=6526 RepID=A0A9W2YST7_BIOGL|nr:uncharacterized protein LOC106061311 isoform X1 [Biomphalaria glabrata]XP_055865775.1 uncharacterized protein LOC106061311 isoform X1 [Biomphalaria glabrata]